MLSELQAIADLNHGLIRPCDLATFGLDRNAMRSVLGKLYRVGRGLYTIQKPRNPQEVHYYRTAGALLARPEAKASHVSAAVIHGLPLFRPDLARIHLDVPDAHSLGQRSSAHLHLARSPDTVRVAGLPVTGIAATIIDCARSQTRETAVVMADSALHRRLVTASQLQEATDSCGTAWGISRARNVVRLADGRSESAGESRSRLICLDAGISVTPQVEVRDERGYVLARMDLGVDGLPMGIEFDGKGKYRDYVDPDSDPDEKYWQEKVRKELIEDYGRILVPVYWKMLDRTDLVLARVRRGMTRARRLAG